MLFRSVLPWQRHRASSPIAATSSIPSLRQPFRSIRGELANIPDPFPLFPALRFVVLVTVELRRRHCYLLSSRRPRLLAPPVLGRCSTPRRVRLVAEAETPFRAVLVRRRRAVVRARARPPLKPARGSIAQLEANVATGPQLTGGTGAGFRVYLAQDKMYQEK